MCPILLFFSKCNKLFLGSYISKTLSETTIVSSLSSMVGSEAGSFDSGSSYGGSRHVTHVDFFLVFEIYDPKNDLLHLRENNKMGHIIGL